VEKVVSDIQERNKMEDLIEIRRQRNSLGHFKGHLRPVMKVDIKKGRFCIFQKFAEAINAKENDALMFAMSKSNKCAFVFKENPEPDNYKLSFSNRGYFRFTCKTLAEHFKNVFELVDGDSAVFEVNPIKNEKGYHKLTLIEL
jgi:hypothetical protein